MTADSAQRRQLGELLVEQGVLTDAQLRVALEEQQRSGAPLGEILVHLGFSRGPTVGNALAEQHGGPLRTEYGLALGPSQLLGMPQAQPEQIDDRSSATHGATAARRRIAQPSREQDTAIARLTAALNERTQELERTRTDLAALERLTAELATATDNLETVQRELAEVREERTRAQQTLELTLEQHKAELAAVKARLAESHEERSGYDSRVQKLEHQLAQARPQPDALADTQRAQDELRRALDQHKAELTQAQEERTEHANRVSELERQLEHARTRRNDTTGDRHTLRELELTLEPPTTGPGRAPEEQARTQYDETADAQHEQRALVAAAVALAQRGYGPPLRPASTQEVGRGDDERRDPLDTDDDRAESTDLPKANGITIKLWQLALFIALVPSLLYALVPVSEMPAAALVVLLVAVVVMHVRRTKQVGKSPSPGTTDGATTELPVSH
jgi:DNA repair exonuclease SbcCD ATPase subunit